MSNTGVAAIDSDCLALLAPDMEGVQCGTDDLEGTKIKWGINMTPQENLSPGDMVMYITTEPDNEPFPCLLESGELPYCETSTTGVVGQKITPHKNYKERINSGYDKTGEIVGDIRIHTPGNTNVNRADFPKWSRWYQEFKNVQIFRINEGEYKVDSDSRGRSAARIEAESREAWPALSNSWKRFTGTFTLIKANDATIFQVFWSGGKAWSVILDVDQAGHLWYVERRGITKDVFGPDVSVLLRPFVVTVCDNGLAAEVFIDGVSQSSTGGPYDGVSDGWPRPDGAKTHFRWGTYVTSVNRNKEINKAVGSLMFVAGSRVDDVEGETCGPL